MADLVATDAGQLRIRALDKPALKGVLERRANYVTIGEKGINPGRAPGDVIADLLAAAEKPLPLLLGLAYGPIFAPPGVLCAAPGYHPESRYFLALDPALVIPAVSASPSAGEVERAKALLLDQLLGDFPFATAADRANAVACLLLPFARLLIKGPTPLYLIEAPTPSSGKTLLASALTVVFLGRPPAVMTEGRDEEEWRKRITARLLTDPMAILIDNVRSGLDSAALAAALTAAEWEDRELGHSRTVTLPIHSLWLATANNPDLSLEIARRTAPIRLDAGVSRPWERQEFRHEDLMGWATANRGELIWAALTLIQAYVAAGMPPGKLTLGSYENWAKVMGGVLEVCEIPGFMANRERLYAQADRETAAWEAFCWAWHEEFGDLAAGSDQLFHLATRKQLLLEIWGGRDDRGARTRFGLALARMRDRVVGEFRVQQAAPDTHNKGQRYQLVLARSRQSAPELAPAQSPLLAENPEPAAANLRNLRNLAEPFPAPKISIPENLANFSSLVALGEWGTPPAAAHTGAAQTAPDSSDPVSEEETPWEMEL